MVELGKLPDMTAFFILLYGTVRSFETLSQTFWFQFIRSLRPLSTIPIIFLVHAGYKLAGADTNWVAAYEAFLIAAFAMLTNDYVDRHNDAKKGKTFAKKYEAEVLGILVFFWIVIPGVVFLAFPDVRLWMQADLMFRLITVGILYSFTRKLILVPTLLVAYSVATTLLFGYYATGSPAPGILSIAVFFFIFGRELLKDIEDKDSDQGYKETLVSRGLLHTPDALRLSAVAYTIAAIFIALLLFGIGKTSHLVDVGVIVVILFSVRMGIVPVTDIKQQKILLDLGMICILLGILTL